MKTLCLSVHLSMLFFYIFTMFVPLFLTFQTALWRRERGRDEREGEKEVRVR